MPKHTQEDKLSQQGGWAHALSGIHLYKNVTKSETWCLLQKFTECPLSCLSLCFSIHTCQQQCVFIGVRVFYSPVWVSSSVTTTFFKNFQQFIPFMVKQSPYEQSPLLFSYLQTFKLSPRYCFLSKRKQNCNEHLHGCLFRCMSGKSSLVRD